jgi:alpha-ribazole phosphatase
MQPGATLPLTRWWWIRHAPVPDGGRIYGQRDLDCDCSDSATFAALARQLPRNAIWLTSHVVRTRQTAAAIRAAMGAPFESDEPRAVAELAEQNLGDWQGLDRQEFFARRGPEALSLEYVGRDIVAVTHGGTIRAALAHAWNVMGEDVLSYVVDNCSLTRIDRFGFDGVECQWRVVEINRRPASS